MKIGDYIRTDIGEIRKVVRVTDDLYVLDKDVVFAHKDKIKKSSPNIIDILEPNDYIRLEDRGNTYYQVVEVPWSRGKNILAIEDRTWSELEELIDEGDEIVAVITHEQMQNMEYKIESEN